MKCTVNVSGTGRTCLSYTLYQTREVSKRLYLIKGGVLWTKAYMVLHLRLSACQFMQRSSACMC